MKGVIFTYALTACGVVAPLFSPFIGLLIYVCFAILRPQELWAFALPEGGRYSLLVALGLLIGWILHGCGRWEFGKAGGVIFALLAYWAWIAFTASLASDKDVAFSYLENMSKGLLPCLVAITLIDSMQKLKQLAWLIVACQGYLAFEFNLQYYAGQIHPNQWMFASLDNNSIAIVTVASLGMAFFLGLDVKSGWMKLAALAVAGLMVHVILFSMSRGGMLSLIITGTVAFLLLPKQPKHYLIFTLAVLLAIRLAGPQVVERFETIFAEKEERDASAESRVELTRALCQAAMDHPITGLGPAHWALYSHEYGFTKGKAGHNTWAQVAAETGLPGLAFLLGFYLVCMARLWPLTRDSYPVADPWLRFLARAVIASLTGFLASASFVSIEGAELPYYVAIIGAGVLKLDSLSRDGRDPGADDTDLDYQAIA
jgi:probable O-glycosylation ligase (exosortase A-associated)